jgi:hypothetical protein
MKKLIGIFLLALMVTQLLPIKEVGKLLFNNQIVEEHPVEGGYDHAKKLFKEIKFFKPLNEHQGQDPQLLLGAMLYDGFADIPSGPAKEIHTPPPNHPIA